MRFEADVHMPRRSPGFHVIDNNVGIGDLRASLRHHSLTTRGSSRPTANVSITGGVGGVPVTGATLSSQKATEMISTELVWRFN